MFSIIVVMAMATSLMAPPALRFVLRRVRPERQELERLRREERVAQSAIAGVHRVLVAVRPRPDESPTHRIVTWVLARLGRDAHGGRSV